MPWANLPGLLLAWRRLVALVFAIATSSGTALADDPAPVPLAEAISVDSVGEACADSGALVERVGHWLRRPSLAAGITVQVELGGEGAAASFELRRPGEPPAVRSFDVLPGECEARLDALGLAIAIAIDPAVIERVADAEAVDDTTPQPPAEQEGEGPETFEEAPPVESVPEESPDPSPQDQPTSRWRHAVSLGGTFAWRLIPDLAATATLGFRSVLEERFVLRVGGWVSSAAEHSLGPGAFESRLFGGRVDACGRWAVPPVGLDVCGGVLAGALRAEGLRFSENLVTTRPWVAVAVGARAEVPLSTRFGLALSAEGVVPLLRPEVHVSDESGTVTVRESVAFFAIQVGLEALVRFP